eukprot:5159428-Amphidinium_carterae.1
MIGLPESLSSCCVQRRSRLINVESLYVLLRDGRSIRVCMEKHRIFQVTLEDVDKSLGKAAWNTETS